MATANMSELSEQIGETAGQIWHVLNDNGPQSLTKLIKEADVSRDLAMLALGWLAREDKVAIEESSRSKIVSLR